MRARIAPASGRVPGKGRGSKHTSYSGKEIMKDGTCKMLSTVPAAQQSLGR